MSDEYFEQFLTDPTAGKGDAVPIADQNSAQGPFCRSCGAVGPGKHQYISTACSHALHSHCRLACKFCSSPCQCTCHTKDSQGLADAGAGKNDAVRERRACAVEECQEWGQFRKCGIWICYRHVRDISISGIYRLYPPQGSHIFAPEQKTGTQIIEEIQALMDLWKARDLMRRTDREQS